MISEFRLILQGGNTLPSQGSHTQESLVKGPKWGHKFPSTFNFLCMWFVFQKTYSGAACWKKLLKAGMYNSKNGSYLKGPGGTLMLPSTVGTFVMKSYLLGKAMLGTRGLGHDFITVVA